MATEITPLQIGERLVGPGRPVYFIAEIGINHNGNPELARRLVDVAAQHGADAVKFQKRNLSALYTRQTLDDLQTTDKELQFVIPFLQQAELSDLDFRRLADYARAKGLEFLCTPWDPASVEFLEELGVPAFKISSADVTNDFLLEFLAATGKPLLMSTGMSTWEEICHAVELLQRAGSPFLLLHCQSTYPAAFKDVNLRMIPRLQEFGVPVGYSGHERGLAVSTAAVAMGACLIERHITLDRTLPGPDHAASLEPQGLQRQIRDIRALELALGTGRPQLSRGEVLNRHALRKSLTAARDLRAGEILTRDMLVALGPGSGLSPQRYRDLLGKPVPRDMAEGEQFRASDLLDLDPARITADFPRPWGCVARYRDADLIASWGPDLIEFHLTDYDLDHGTVPERSFAGRVALHVPEYYHGQLLDLCAPDEVVRASCLDVVRRSLDAARALREGCFPEHQGPIPVVLHPGGMSFESYVPSVPALWANLERSWEELAPEPGVEIMLENVSPLPWYFGGQWYHHLFVAPEDVVSFLEPRGLRTTFDLSHAQLYCNLVGRDILEYLRLVKPLIGHLHLADSSGTDAEAIQFGEGMSPLVEIMRELREVDAPLIPEIWMGHLNGGEGFLLGLVKLREALEAAG